MRALWKLTDDPQGQCNELLALLHTSDNPQAFIQLYRAFSKESQLQRLVERIDNYNDQSVTDLLKQLDISQTTGKCVLYENTPQAAGTCKIEKKMCTNFPHKPNSTCRFFPFLPRDSQNCSIFFPLNNSTKHNRLKVVAIRCDLRAVNG